VIPDLFTIGHSTHSWEQFLELLRQHRIQVLVDVRSSPYSARFPQFNREPMKAALPAAGIRYLFLGDELGARRSERDCYFEGVARYERISQTPAFRAGLERIIKGIQKHRAVLMCAEKDPLECHRTILVCRHLRDVAQIQHILSDGSVESQSDAETRLMAEESVPTDDFFTPRGLLLARAYDQRGNRIAYHEAPQPIPSAEVCESIPSAEVYEPISIREIYEPIPKTGDFVSTTKIPVFTVGFTKKTAAQFFEKLRVAGIHRVVDVRLNKVSQLAGFSKRDDLKYFLKQILNIDYIEAPLLAPTQPLLDAYKKSKGSWEDYERDFLQLMEERHIEEKIDREMIAGGCLLCSEDKPHHCHRRLVVEYLQQHWGNLDIKHIT
jgi:uncharacterized protein (DUF488 family)